METKDRVRILGIETSCDETAAAIVENGRNLLSSVVASQIDIHIEYGGVFPEVASRQHVIAIHNVVQDCLQKAHLSLSEIDAIAVTRGPGLAGSLVVGMNFAKGLSLTRNIPLIGINHLEGHIYSAWLQSENNGYHESEPKFPLLTLIVSGGHTELDLITDHLKYNKLGGTLDDAAGEAFDKVARLLGLPYPGGPSIQNAAKNGDPDAFKFPRARLEGTWNFSFSGLKTAVLREVKALEKEKGELPINDLAASFQAAVVDVLFDKTLQAAEKNNVNAILIAGGVSANESLRQAFLSIDRYPVHIPPLKFCTDNAAMIATAGYYHFINGLEDQLNIDVMPTLPLT